MVFSEQQHPRHCRINGEKRPLDICLRPPMVVPGHVPVKSVDCTTASDVACTLVATEHKTEYPVGSIRAAEHA